MIDWLTLIIDASLLSAESRKKCFSNIDKILRISPEGELRWETVARESIRSDSHYVTVKFGATVQICGSPSRITSCNNVFGSLDIRMCAVQMINFVSSFYGVRLPSSLKLWRCSKIDVTQNFDLGSLAQVRSAIDQLKALKIGRQKTSTEETTVMYGKGSSLHMGKIYAKGPHARKMASQKNAIFTLEELDKADRLLRLEYSMRRHLLRRIHEQSGKEWYDLTPAMLLGYHASYFRQFISTIEVLDMDTVLQKLLAGVSQVEGAIPSEGQARAAYDCYCRCRLVGFHDAKQSFTSSSWYRNVKNLKSIGIVAADLQPINVVPLRRKPIDLGNPVSSWDDIKLEQKRA